MIGKSALRLPAGTITLGGKHDGVTTCPCMLPHTETAAPPAGAGAVSVTVPVVLTPPRILADASVRDAILGAAGGLPGGTTVNPAPGDR